MLKCNKGRLVGTILSQRKMHTIYCKSRLKLQVALWMGGRWLRRSTEVMLHERHQLFYGRKSLIIGLPVWRTRAGANTLTVWDCVMYFISSKPKAAAAVR